jgi:hypothetical protein
MNAGSRAEIVDYLANGAKLREACAMAAVPWAALSADWTEGRRAFEANEDSQAATFYSEAQAARMRARATFRAEAAAVAGTRESADLLAVVRALEAEDEPIAGDGDDPNAWRSQPLFLDTDDPDVREAQHEAHLAYMRLLHVIAKPLEAVPA